MVTSGITLLPNFLKITETYFGNSWDRLSLAAIKVRGIMTKNRALLKNTRHI